MKIAIVHIGGHKTGSSSIQSALRKSMTYLRSLDGMYFCDFDHRVQLLSLGFQARGRRRYLLRMEQKPLPELERESYCSWVKLGRLVRQKNATFTVISNEFLFRIKNTGRLKRILNNIFDRVIIVAYVRNPASRMPSSIDQRIRGGATLEELSDGRPGGPPMLSKLDRYARTFGENNIIVRNFDKRNLRNECVVSDFSGIISKITGQDINILNSGDANRSLPASASAFLLRENQKPRPEGTSERRNWLQNRRRFVDLIRQYPSLMIGEKLQLDDPVLSGHIWNVFADEVNEINQRFLSDQIGMVPGKPGPQLTKHELREAIERWIYRNELAHVNQALSEIGRNIKFDKSARN